jgi:glycine dehydrogenase subunit 1
VHQQLLQNKIVGGLTLKRWYPELGNASLWCCTEMNTREQIDAAAHALAGMREPELAGKK